MDSETTATLPATKLTKNGKPTHKYVGGPVALNARMIRMILLMINGHPDDPSRTQYGLYDAAAAVGYHRRAARALAMAPVFMEAYWTVYRGESNAGKVPTIEEVREQIARRTGGKAGYIIRMPPRPTIPEPMP
jgi:hypothetical protein